MATAIINGIVVTGSVEEINKLIILDTCSIGMSTGTNINPNGDK